MAGVVRSRRGRWVGKLIWCPLLRALRLTDEVWGLVARARTTAATRPDAVGSSATAATVRPSDAASAAVERPMATKRQLPSGARSAWMRRAALGEAATTACSRPAPISALASAAVSTVAAARAAPGELRSAAAARRLAGGEAAARVGRIIHGVVGGDGLDGGAAGLEALAEPRVGDVRLRQEHAALVLRARCRAARRRTAGPVGARSTAMPAAFQDPAGRRADRGHAGGCRAASC